MLRFRLFVAEFLPAICTAGEHTLVLSFGLLSWLEDELEPLAFTYHSLHALLALGRGDFIPGTT